MHERPSNSVFGMHAAGAGGFAYAARTMGLCAAPAVGCMLVGSGVLGGEWSPTPDGKLAAVWAGLVTLMGMRALAIAAPYWTRRPPFARLFEDGSSEEQAQG